MAIATYLAAGMNARDQASLWLGLCKAAGVLGFAYVAYLGADYILRADQRAVRTTYPDVWRHRYAHAQYRRLDPVLTVARCRQAGFTWDVLANAPSLTPRQHLILEEARTAGLVHGVTVPLHGPGSRVDCLSFARSGPPIGPEELATLQRLGHLFMADLAEPRSDDACPGNPPHLTQRERDCLLWAGRGKSDWEIGQILNISPGTVHFHMRRAMMKLKASRRVVAVLRAMQSGLIADIGFDPEETSRA